MRIELDEIRKKHTPARTSPLKTAVLVLDECNTLSFASAVDPMRAANRLADRPAFDWDYVTATAGTRDADQRAERARHPAGPICKAAT